MKELEKHEQFEIQVLDLMRKTKLLDRLVFGGGTMLRLCHQLSRFSVDLDFFLKNPDLSFHIDFEKLATTCRENGWQITDQVEKHFSWLLEIKAQGFPRRLKIEIRKDESSAQDQEMAIAFSKHEPTTQIRLTVCTLQQMWKNKVEALLDRKTIRDAYDLEFMIRRGIKNFSQMELSKLHNLIKIVSNFNKQDFTSTLGSLLPTEERTRLATSGFSLLSGSIQEELSKR
ncbi:MAG: nucleotidyl transferase AbiEii/AbiGii toxin family protein [Pseudomonadota bacterium]